MPNCEVDDGPISKENYWKKENIIKVLHLLKEPTEQNDSIPNLVINKGLDILSTTLFRVSARRSHCIQNNKYPDWKTIKELEKQVLFDALKKSAVVNLSKICRFDKERKEPRTTPRRLVFEFAKNYYERWFGKLQECKPNVVICGGTFDAVLKTLKIKDEDIKYTSTGMCCFKTIDALFLDCRHPRLIGLDENIEYTYFAESIADLFEKEKEILGVI
jgi:hypothetical protein